MTTNSNWLQDLAGFIASQGGGALADSIFVAQIPEEQPAATLCTVLLPTRGSSPERSSGFRYPGLQILHRSANFFEAWNESNRVFGILDNARPKRLGEFPNFTLMPRIEAQSDPYLLTRDDNHAFIVACNYQITLQAG